MTLDGVIQDAIGNTDVTNDLLVLGQTGHGPWHGLVFVLVTGTLVFWAGLSILFKRGFAERQSRIAVAFQERLCLSEFQKQWIRKLQTPIAYKIVSVLMMAGWLLALSLSIRDMIAMYW